MKRSVLIQLQLVALRVHHLCELCPTLCWTQHVQPVLECKLFLSLEGGEQQHHIGDRVAAAAWLCRAAPEELGQQISASAWTNDRGRALCPQGQHAACQECRRRRRESWAARRDGEIQERDGDNLERDEATRKNSTPEMFRSQIGIFGAHPGPLRDANPAQPSHPL